MQNIFEVQEIKICKNLKRTKQKAKLNLLN